MKEKTSSMAQFNREITKATKAKKEITKEVEQLKLKVKRANTALMKSQGGCDEIHQQTVREITMAIDRKEKRSQLEIERLALEKEIEDLSNEVDFLKDQQEEIEVQCDMANEELEFALELLPAYKLKISQTQKD